MAKTLFNKKTGYECSKELGLKRIGNGYHWKNLNFTKQKNKY